MRVMILLKIKIQTEFFYYNILKKLKLFIKNK